MSATQSASALAGLASLFLVLTSSPAAGFAAVSPLSQALVVVSSQNRWSSALHAAYGVNPSHVPEDQYPQLLHSASLCAHSESCSIELAEAYLREIVHIQSGCAAGTLSGDKVCEGVGMVCEVVADLRDKIESGKRGVKQEVRLVHHFVYLISSLDSIFVLASSSSLIIFCFPQRLLFISSIAEHHFIAFRPFHFIFFAFFDDRTFWDRRQEEFENLITVSLHPTNGLSPTAAWTRSPIKPAYLAFAALYTVVMISSLHSDNVDGGAAIPSVLSGVAPFAAQEVWWAIRDGYIGDLTEHWLRNGGLVVIGNASSSAAAAASSSGNFWMGLTPQEVWWAIRDGYAADALFASNNGDGSEIISIEPMRPQEVWWAIRDGYATDILKLWWRNGGNVIRLW